MMTVKRKNYFDECIKLLSILKERYGGSLVWHIDEATSRIGKSKSDLTDEDLYIALLEHKESQTIYHNIEEESSIDKIYQDGIDLNKMFLDEDEDEEKNEF